MISSRYLTKVLGWDLSTLGDSVSVIDEMLAEHYHFEAITSLSTDHWAGELRPMNWKDFFFFFFFGAFPRVLVLKLAETKTKSQKNMIEDIGGLKTSLQTV